jgi:transcriptional regulator with XRE-family HTH domain
MKRDVTPAFGEYLRSLREERKFGVRELARMADLDAGGLTRLEAGKTTPNPKTLKALGAALDVPFVDLFARAGYITPSELPSMSTYLRTRYGHLSEDALIAVDDYVRQLIEKRGLDPDGPAPHQDETEHPSEK